MTFEFDLEFDLYSTRPCSSRDFSALQIRPLPEMFVFVMSILPRLRPSGCLSRERHSSLPSKQPFTIPFILLVLMWERRLCIGQEVVADEFSDASVIRELTFSSLRAGQADFSVQRADQNAQHLFNLLLIS